MSICMLGIVISDLWLQYMFSTKTAVFFRSLVNADIVQVAANLLYGFGICWKIIAYNTDCTVHTVCFYDYVDSLYELRDQHRFYAEVMLYDRSLCG